MKKCERCGRKGLFLKLQDGLCANCFSEIEESKRLEVEAAQKAAEEAKRQEIEAAQRAAEEQRLRALRDPSNLLNNVKRKNISRPPMYNGQPMVYEYLIRALDVDRPALYEMTKTDDYYVKMAVAKNGDILLVNNDIPIAKLGGKTQIATDWIKKDRLYLCQFTGFQKGKECVVLLLYRDDEARFSDSKMSIAKLVSCSTEERQYNIDCLEEGQKLFVDEDDDGKQYVRDIDYHDVGRLPAKFYRMFEDDSLLGMYFDHTETVENSNGDDVDVPFVRFYYDEF